MTTESNKDHQPLVFVRAKELKREPLTAQTDEEVLAAMDDLVKRNERVLQTLAEL